MRNILKSKKVIAFIVMFLMTGIMFMSSVISVNANVATEPSFTVSIDSVTPNVAIVGEDITIKGTITPEPFETEIPENEIVLVLDTSYRMNKVHNGATDYFSTPKIRGEHNNTIIDNENNEVKKAAKTFIEKMKDIPNLKVSVVPYSNTTEESFKAKEENEDINENLDYTKLDTEFIDVNDSELISIIDNLDKIDEYDDESFRIVRHMIKNGNEDANKTVVFISNLGFKVYSTNLNNDNLCDKVIKEDIAYLYEINGQNDATLKENKIEFDSIVEKVQKDILSGYTLKNINIDADLNSEFMLSTGGDTIALDNINYKIDGKINNGRAKYIANPVDFEFTIKAKDNAELGVSDLFNSATVTFPWEGKNISTDIPNTIIEVKENNLLKIEAELVDDKTIKAYPGDEINITYEIKAEDFVFNGTNNQGNTKDVVVVVDVSSGMNLTNVKNALFNKLINDSNLKSHQIKYSFITYSNDVKVLNNFIANTDKNTETLRLIINDKINNDSSTKKNIGLAISEAVQVLNDPSKGASEDADKYIVLIGWGKQEYDISDSNSAVYSAFEEVKKDMYNVITLSSDEKQSDNDPNEQGQWMKILHESVLGKDSLNFILAKNNNEIHNEKMEKVAKLIKDSSNHTSYKRDVQLRFELGDNFRQVVNGETLNSDTITIDLPKVIFKNKGNNLYHAENIEPVTFRVKVVGNKYGECKFEKGTINYINLINEKISSSIEVPLIKVIQPVKDIIHGVQNINTEGKEEFIENAITIAENMDANITAGAKISSNKIDMKLCINKIIDMNSGSNINNIKLYKEVNGKLVEVAHSVEFIKSNDSQNEYKINIQEEIKEEISIVIKYLVNMESNNQGKSYTNNFIIDGMEKPFIINGAKMPSLF